MSGGELALFHQRPHRRGEPQQPQGIGHGAAGLAHALGRLLLGHVVIFNQRLKPGGLLHGVEVLPLEIFDHGQLCGLSVIRLHDNDGTSRSPARRAARQRRSPAMIW